VKVFSNIYHPRGVSNLADLEIAGGVEQQVGRFEVTVQYIS